MQSKPFEEKEIKTAFYSSFCYLQQEFLLMIQSGNDKPLISVVLTTYNGAQFLPQQLDSLLAQTYPAIEIIAVDDKSGDNSFAILQAYAQRHPIMKVYRNEENLGFVKNFEKACRLSTGQLIALCDQDDVWLPQKLEQLQLAIGDHALVHCNSALCNEALEPIGVLASDRAHFKPIENCLEQAIFCRIYGHASLITRELLEASFPFLPNIPHDWWLCFMATFHGGIHYLPDVGVHYRQHAQNTIGAVGGRSRKEDLTGKKIKSKEKELRDIRARVQAFYNICPNSLVQEKKVLDKLVKSYASFSLPNNWLRMILFFRYRDVFLGVKKRNALRKWLFCVKMFWTVK